MTDVVAISVDENKELFTLAFEHSYEVYSLNPIKLKFKKEFINFRINSISTSHEGNITVFSIFPLSSASSQYNVMLWNNFFGELENELNQLVDNNNNQKQADEKCYKQSGEKKQNIMIKYPL